VRNVGLRFQSQFIVEKRCTWKEINWSVGWDLHVDIKISLNTVEL
jgi:hypothetical protein